MIRTCTIKLRTGRRRRDQARLGEVLGLCRVLYNAALESRRDAWRKQRLSRTYFDQCKELTELRKLAPEYAALDVTMMRMTALKRLDLAYKAFFRRIKSGDKPGFPRFRGRDRFDTLVFGESGWKLSKGKLAIRGVGWFRVAGKLHREGELKGLRLVRKAGRWYAHVLVDVGEAPAVRQSKNGIGIDVGLRTFATLSDGERIAHPRFLRKSLEQLKSAQQRLSRCKRQSKRRRRRRLELARIHHKMANRRRNFVHQTAASLAKRYDGFAVEDLDVQQMASTERSPVGMGKKASRGLRRGIMDSAWAMFMTHLAAKAEEAALPFVRVNPRGTTQRCSGCGSLVRKTLRDRMHDCSACGLLLDRDENAARNIHDLGWRSAAQAAENPS